MSQTFQCKMLSHHGVLVDNNLRLQKGLVPFPELQEPTAGFVGSVRSHVIRSLPTSGKLNLQVSVHSVPYMYVDVVQENAMLLSFITSSGCWQDVTIIIKYIILTE